MKTVFLLAALMAWGLSEVRGNFMKSRYMINMVMGRNVIPDYNPYGCYCGLEGKGTPKDGTDRCCWKQDCCYSDLKKYNCDTKKVMYRYRYADGILSCGYGSYCQIRICTCDAQAVSCMLQNRKSYKAKYRNLPNSQCKGKAPKC